MKVILTDRAGNKVSEIETQDGPFQFTIKTASGWKEYTLSFIYKRDNEGGRDPTKLKGAMLQ